MQILRIPDRSSIGPQVLVQEFFRRGFEQFQAEELGQPSAQEGQVGRVDDTVGNPHRAQVSQFELFKLILLLKLDKQFPVEQFEATASRSTAPPPS